MKLKNNVMIFDTDDECTDYCISANPKICQTTIADRPPIAYYDYPFTDEYNELVDKGVGIHVLEPNSKVMKRKCVTRGVVSKKLQNIIDNIEDLLSDIEED